MRILVTGTNGFIGGHLVRKLETEGNDVVRLVRGATASTAPSVFSGPERLADLERSGPWPEGIEAVVHLAARISSGRGGTAPDVFESNVDGTRALAKRARAEGVKRIVFLSTANVHGLGRDAPYSEDDPLDPPSPYARSKKAAEEAFWDALGDDKDRGTVLRPPPVYGKGGHGRVAALVKLAKLPLPLPLKGLGAPRSVIAVDHLAGIISLCLRSDAARGGTFLVADDEPVRPEDIVAAVRQGLKRPASLVPAPVVLARSIAGMAGLGDAWRLRTLPCLLDTTLLKTRLGWTSPASTVETIRRMATTGEI